MPRIVVYMLLFSVSTRSVGSFVRPVKMVTISRSRVSRTKQSSRDDAAADEPRKRGHQPCGSPIRMGISPATRKLSSARWYGGRSVLASVLMGVRGVGRSIAALGIGLLLGAC